MNIPSNFVLHRSWKFNYRQPPWMNPKISSLKKCLKLTKLFYKNPSDSLKELIMSKSTECSNLIITAKKWREDGWKNRLPAYSSPKACCSMLNNFFGKKTSNILPLIVNDLGFQTLQRKLISLITFSLLLQCLRHWEDQILDQIFLSM